MDSLSLEYELTEKEYIAGVGAGSNLTIGRTVGVLNSIICAAAGVGFAAIGLGLGWLVVCYLLPDLVSWDRATLPAAVLMILVGIAVISIRDRHTASRLVQAGNAGMVTLRMTPEGVQYGDANFNAEFPWSSVRHVADFKDGITLCAGAVSYVIPGRALPDAFGKDDLLSLLEGWRSGQP